MKEDVYKIMIKCELITHTPNPDNVVATSARLCYSNNNVEDIIKTFNKDDNKLDNFINKLNSLGHLSPFEHVSFTFGIEGVSRTLSHQLVRHRIASYSQKSQRYVNEHNFDFIVPPTIKNNKDAEEMYKELMRNINGVYQSLVALNIPKEDARYVLPNATETKLIVTFNARSLLNFFSLRCCTRAQWEIRQLANLMLIEVKKVAPLLFKNAGAFCKLKGYCQEEDMSCGIAPTLQKILINNKQE